MDDLFDSRLTEQSNPRTRDIDLADPLAIVDLINAEDRGVPEAVRREREGIARAIELAVECFRQGGRLIYVGAGTSGRLGVLDASECPPTFGTDPRMVQGIIAGGPPALVRSQEGAEDRAEDGAAAIDDMGVGPTDFVLGIATSATTPYVRGALRRAAERGSRTGFLCCTEPGEEMRGLVDVSIVPLVGPEVVAGSTRMKAGTATKLVLNTITTGAMIRLGKVYRNLMVDLRALSRKLVDRTQRIVMATVGCDREGARELIEAAGGSAKLAVVMGVADVGPDLGRLYLAEGGGFVRLALELAERATEASSGAGDPYAVYPVAPADDESIAYLRAGVGTFPERVESAVAASTDEDLKQRAPSGRWSVKEHLRHLIDIDLLVGGRMEDILTRDEPAIMNRDDEVANRAVETDAVRESAIDELLGELSEGRRSLVTRLGSAARPELARTGRHERFGTISLYQVLRHLIWHDERHLKAIRRLLQG